MALGVAILLFASGCRAAGEPSPTTEATATGAGTATSGPVLRPASPPPTVTPTPAIPETPLPTAPGALEPSEPFGTDAVTLHGDGRTVQVSVYIADTPDLRARGLMGREHLPAGTGMLFVYDSDTTGTFWMRDTLIPLSIGFFDADGDAVAFFDMEPCTTPNCPSYGPDTAYRHALEVPQGWFDEQGVDLDWNLDVS